MAVRPNRLVRTIGVGETGHSDPIPGVDLEDGHEYDPTPAFGARPDRLRRTCGRRLRRGGDGTRRRRRGRTRDAGTRGRAGHHRARRGARHRHRTGRRTRRLRRSNRRRGRRRTRRLRCRLRTGRRTRRLRGSNRRRGRRRARRRARGSPTEHLRRSPRRDIRRVPGHLRPGRQPVRPARRLLPHPRPGPRPGSHRHRHRRRLHLVRASAVEARGLRRHGLRGPRGQRGRDVRHVRGGGQRAVRRYPRPHHRAAHHRAGSARRDGGRGPQRGLHPGHRGLRGRDTAQLQRLPRLGQPVHRRGERDGVHIDAGADRGVHGPGPRPPHRAVAHPGGEPALARGGSRGPRPTRRQDHRRRRARHAGPVRGGGVRAGRHPGIQGHRSSRLRRDRLRGRHLLRGGHRRVGAADAGRGHRRLLQRPQRGVDPGLHRRDAQPGVRAGGRAVLCLGLQLPRGRAGVIQDRGLRRRGRGQPLQRRADHRRRRHGRLPAGGLRAEGLQRDVRRHLRGQQPIGGQPRERGAVHGLVGLRDGGDGLQHHAHGSAGRLRGGRQPDAG